MLDGGVCLAIEISTASQPLSLSLTKPIPCLISGHLAGGETPVIILLQNFDHSVYYGRIDYDIPRQTI